MIYFTRQQEPAVSDLDSQKALLAFNAVSQCWDSIALTTFEQFEHYSHWMPKPPPVQSSAAEEGGEDQFDVELLEPTRGLRLAPAIRATHRATGISVVNCSTTSQLANERRARASLDGLLTTLSCHEAERCLLEDSLGQALALVAYLADGFESPLGPLIDAQQRAALKPVSEDIAFEIGRTYDDDIWGGIYDLFSQLLDVATSGDANELRQVFLSRYSDSLEADQASPEAITSMQEARHEVDDLEVDDIPEFDFGSFSEASPSADAPAHEGVPETMFNVDYFDKSSDNTAEHSKDEFEDFGFDVESDDAIEYIRRAMPKADQSTSQRGDNEDEDGDGGGGDNTGTAGTSFEYSEIPGFDIQQL